MNILFVFRSAFEADALEAVFFITISSIVLKIKIGICYSRTLAYVQRLTGSHLLKTCQTLNTKNKNNKQKTKQTTNKQTNKHHKTCFILFVY